MAACSSAGVLATLAALVLCASAALFPDPSVSINLPVLADETCSLELGSYPCDAACPLASAPASGDYSTIVAEECTCNSLFPVPTTASLCCDSNGTQCRGRVNAKAHPPQLAIDGDMATYWQTQARPADASISFDLEIERELSKITFHFKGAAPSDFKIERSQDGTTWTAYQFYAIDCLSTFGMQQDGALTAPDAVVCSSPPQAVAPSGTTQVSFSPVSSARKSLASNTYVRSERLQRFARASYLRLSIVDLYDETTARDDFDAPIATVPFIRLAEVEVAGRCSCNGHAEVCSETGPEDDLRCICSHNAAGDNCEVCLPLFNNKPWRRGLDVANPNECERCECNNHAVSCVYSQATFNETGIGGVCTDCTDNTAGQQCESCKHLFYKNPAVLRTSPDSCLACNCFAAGRTNDGGCDLEDGQCACKTNVEGRQCDQCKDEFFGLSAALEVGCNACDCNVLGTVGGSNVCDKVTGQCPCLDSTTGRRCDQCAVGYFLPDGRQPGQCEPCHPECGDLGCVRSGNEIHVSCLNCKNVLDGDFCLATCPTFKFADNHTVCQDCNAECVGGCTGPDPTLFDCTGGCEKFALARSLGGKCVDECPSDTYKSEERVCELCDEQCLFCTGDGPEKCLACRNAKLGNVCVATCPANTYRDSNKICQPCSPLCDDSTVCSGPASHQCGLCEFWTDLTSSIYEYNCVRDCPTLSYKGVQTFKGAQNVSTCLRCNAECAVSCDGPTNADCVGGCKNFAYEGTCVNACPANTYLEDKFCKPCNEGCDATKGCTGPHPDQCAACGDHAVQFNQETSFECLLECPFGFYADAGKICRACDEECDGCNAGTSAHCLRCANFFDTLGEECVATCGIDFHVVPETVTISDPDDNMANVTEYHCIPCDEECFGGCTGDGNRACKLCKHVSWKNACYSSCPVGSYHGTDTNCITCDQQCGSLGCVGGGADKCQNCRNFRQGSTCVASCSPDHVAMNTTCQPCHPQCSKTVVGCLSPAAKDCFECLNFRNTLDNACVETCPHGTYVDGKLCKPCNLECDGCTGPSTTQCKACRHVSFDEECLETCPIGRYADASNECQVCNAECAEDCVGGAANQCVSVEGRPHCKNLLRQSTQECVATCDLAFDFMNEAGDTCIRCHQECGNFGCDGPTNRDCFGCANALFDDQCLRTCPNDHYKDAQGICQACDEQCTGKFGNSSDAQGFNDPYCVQAGPQHCHECLHFESKGVCVAACDSQLQFQQNGVCLDCHPQCKGGCHGGSSSECTACKAWTHGSSCVALCPVDSTYSNAATATCEPCHEECDVSLGSGGCSTGTGRTQCARCKHVLYQSDCLDDCPQGFYPSLVDTTKALGGVCQQCHPQCHAQQGCFGPGANQCNACSGLIQDGVCVTSCDSKHFQNGQICQACSALCSIGCTGAGPDNCKPDDGDLSETAASYGCTNAVLVTPQAVVCKAACDLGTYRDANGICQACSPLCGVELGCTGPLKAGCISCDPEMYLDTSDLRCKPCNSQCAEGGCSGPSASDCNICRGVRVGQECRDNCHDDLNIDRYLDNSGDEARCLKCDVQCADGGCTGAGPENCLSGCDNFVDFGLRLQSVAVCVEDCGVNSYVDNSPQPNTCHNCSSLCVDGCNGPLASDCTKCRWVKGRDGDCVRNCGLNEVNRAGQCECADNAVADGDSCGLCHAQCNGCHTPNNAGDCIKCKRRERNGICIADCLETEAVEVTTDGRQVCKPCHIECSGGCHLPNDASQCKTKCKHYFNDGVCVADCPSSKPFLVSDLTKYPLGSACVAECPLSAQYYNDTRSPNDPDGKPLAPQLCVKSCAQLGPERSFLAPDSTMCTTQEQAAKASGDSGSDNATIIVAAVVGGIALLLLIVILVLVFRRRKSDVQDLSHTSLPNRNSVTDFGGGSSDLYFDPTSDASWSAGRHDARRAYLDSSFFPAPGSDAYMEVTTRPFTPGSDNMQSTHM